MHPGQCMLCHLVQLLWCRLVLTHPMGKSSNCTRCSPHRMAASNNQHDCDHHASITRATPGPALLLLLLLLQGAAAG